MKNVGQFFLCLLKGKCVYSIKKLLAFIFMGLIIYLAIWTDKTELINSFLIMLGSLLAIRTIDKITIKTPEE